MDRRWEWTPVIALAIALLCFVWLSAAVGRGKSIGFDEACRTGLQSLASPGLTLLMRGVTTLGSQAVLLALAGCAATWIYLSGARREAWLIVIGMAGAELLLAILKVEFHRQRPDPLFGGVAPDSYSFPSGHALLSFCCYYLLAESAIVRLRGWGRQLAPIGAVVLILAIGISRVYLGAHHATDVIAGYLVGSVWLAALMAIGRV